MLRRATRADLEDVMEKIDTEVEGELHKAFSTAAALELRRCADHFLAQISEGEAMADAFRGDAIVMARLEAGVEAIRQSAAILRARADQLDPPGCAGGGDGGG